MKEQAVNIYARNLFGTMGPKAEAFVAQKIEAMEDVEDQMKVEEWRRIRRAVQMMRTRSA